MFNDFEKIKVLKKKFLRDNSLNLDLSPHKANLIHTPTQQKQQLVASISHPRNSRSSFRSTGTRERGGGEGAGTPSWNPTKNG